MDAVDGVFDAAALDEAGDADLGGADDLEVDACIGECPKHTGGNTGIAEHSGSDNGDLRDIIVNGYTRCVDVCRNPFDDAACFLGVNGCHREHHVGYIGVSTAEALHDHIHVDVRISESREYLVGNARDIGDTEHRDLSDVLIVCDTANDKGLFFHCIFLPNDGSGF